VTGTAAYPERVRIVTDRFTIEGSSRAGNETWFRLRELGIALDIGRCPDLLVGIPHVLLTHAHLDHALGVPFYFSQRNVQKLPTGTVYVPRPSEAEFERLMEVHERLEGVAYDHHFVGLSEGDSVNLRKDLRLRVHASSHRIPTNAYELLEVRHKLKPEHAGLSGPDLAELRAAAPGTLHDEFEHSLLLYTGDTDRRILERNSALFKTAVLMIECSFTADGDQQRGALYRHMHIDDIFEFSERFENEMIVLTHFSLRNSHEEIRANIARRCPVELKERIRLALPEPFSRL